MKPFKSLSLLLLLTVLVMSSCKKDDEAVNDNTDQVLEQIPEVLINASINGTVIDETGTPMEDVMVQLGTNTTFTNVNGLFTFSNKEMNQNGAVISAEKDGYFNNTKVILANPNKTSNSKIMLIEKVVTATFVASAGGTSTTNGGAKIVIPADGVKLENGGSYNGAVNVYATWLDPTADDLSLRMPGDLRATSSDDVAVKLETYGMIGVELEGDNGEALNIADGQTATIEIPIPASLLGSAPSTIPLWHFDEVTGYWVQEGEATLTSDNSYVGTVSHFSFWNVDVPYPLVDIEGTITASASQIGISGLDVQITINSNGNVGYGITDSDGWYGGYVPADEDLTITVFGDCEEELYTGQIGPFSTDAIVPTIAISSPTLSFLEVSGVLLDCNNDLEPYGYVYLDFGGSSYNFIYTNSSGEFNSIVNVCDHLEVSISGISNDPFSQGTTTVHDISGLSELDLGSLITCW